jgi:hypothetical protein
MVLPNADSSSDICPHEAEWANCRMSAYEAANSCMASEMTATREPGELVKRLRALARKEHSDYSIGDEAADEIERLSKTYEEIKWEKEQQERAHYSVQEYIGKLEAQLSAPPAAPEGDYPSGNVIGPCICGGWPGGPCLHCPLTIAASIRDFGFNAGVEAAAKAFETMDPRFWYAAADRIRALERK